MIDIDKLTNHIKTLRTLLSYEKASLGACEAMAAMEDMQRKGKRGGRMTTLSARWSRNAEARDRVLSLAVEQAKTLFSLVERT